MRRINNTFVIMLIVAFALAGCKSSNSASDSKKTEKPKELTIELKNTYTTKFMEVASIGYPNFQISYPDNWTLSDDMVDPEDTFETFTLTDKKGTQIKFYHLENDFGMGSNADASIVEISKTGESDFIPGMIQATDKSSLGSFSVMKIATKELIRIHDDGSMASKKINTPDNKCIYAVLPDSKIGSMECRQPIAVQFSFDYSGTISIIATPPENGAFTDQELKETLAILKSFRTE